jgi:hypothetical protein
VPHTVRIFEYGLGRNYSAPGRAEVLCRLLLATAPMDIHP